MCIIASRPAQAQAAISTRKSVEISGRFSTSRSWVLVTWYMPSVCMPQNPSAPFQHGRSCGAGLVELRVRDIPAPKISMLAGQAMPKLWISSLDWVSSPAVLIPQSLVRWQHIFTRMPLVSRRVRLERLSFVKRGLAPHAYVRRRVLRKDLRRNCLFPVKLLNFGSRKLHESTTTLMNGQGIYEALCGRSLKAVVPLC